MSNISGEPGRDSELQLLLQLISAELDGEASDSEIMQLRQLQDRYPGESRLFRSRCESLGTRLRLIPVQAAVLRVSPGESKPGAALVVHPSAVRIGRWGIPATFGAAAAAVVAFVVVSLNSVKSSNESALVADSSGSSEMLPPAAPEANAWMSPAAPSARSPQPSDGASGAAMAKTESDVATLHKTAFGELPTADKWRVLVVRMQTGDIAGIKGEVADLLERHGLKMSPSQAATMPEWLGVCIPSTLPMQRELLADVQEKFMAQAQELDPAGIMRFSREEIVHLVTESLNSPTQTELRGGELFVASLPESSEAPGSLVQGKRKAVATAGNGTEDPASGDGGSDRQSATLLVFEFRQGGAEGGLRRIVQ